MSKPLTTMRRLCAAVIAADKAAGRDPSESRTWVREHFLPAIVAEELVVGDVSGPRIEFVPPRKVWVVTKTWGSSPEDVETEAVCVFRSKPSNESLASIGHAWVESAVWRGGSEPEPWAEGALSYVCPHFKTEETASFRIDATCTEIHP